MEDTSYNPVSRVSGFNTEHAAGIVVIGALAALYLIRRGFRGVGVLGANVSVK